MGMLPKIKRRLQHKRLPVVKTLNTRRIVVMDIIKIQSDSWYMQQALLQAEQAFLQDEVPIGALVVASDGAVLGVGFNTVEHNHTQTAHAELQALSQAAIAQKDWRLEGSTLFVTLEPCVMCVGAARLSRISRIVFGASSPLFGFRLDNDLGLWLYNKDSMIIQGGIEEEACSAVLKKFFQQKRKKGEWKKNGKGPGEDKNSTS